MSTKTAHEELKEWLPKDRYAGYEIPMDLIRRAIAEHEKSEGFREELRHKFQVQSDLLAEYRAQLDQLQSRLTAYEKQWTDMHETICKFQEENGKLKSALDASERRGAEMRQLIEDFKPICSEDVEDMQRIEHALSSDCGKGYVSIEQVRPLRVAFEFIRDECDYDDYRIKPTCTKAIEVCKNMDFPASGSTLAPRTEPVAHTSGAPSDEGKLGVISTEQVRVLREALEYARTNEHEDHFKRVSERAHEPECPTCEKLNKALDLCKKLEEK